MRAAAAVLAVLVAAGPAAGELTVRRWTHRDGLPLDSVVALAPSSSGGLWVGTEEGLARLDGPAIWWPVPWLAGEVPRVNVDDLLEDAAGRLWIASRPAGLTVVEGGRARHVAVPGGESGVYSLAASGDGGVWVGTVGGTVVRVGEGGVTAVLRLPGEEVAVDLVEDGRGRLHVATRHHGLLVAEPPFGTAPRRVPGTGGTVTALARDSRGRVWAARFGSGLCVVEGGGACVPVRVRGAPELTRVVALLAARDGRLWVALPRAVLAVGVASREVVEGPVPVPGTWVRALAEAPAGVVWVGTQAGGLVAVHHGPVRALPPRRVVYSVCTDRSGRRWAGTDRGVAVWGDGGRVELPLEVPVYTVHPAREGGVWAGTAGRGLVRCAGWPPRIVEGPLLPGVRVFALAFGPGGALLVGTGNGLVRVEGEAGRRRLSRELPGRTVVAVAASEDGTVWAGTRTRGVAVLAGGSVRWIGRSRGLPSPTVTGIAPDGLRAWVTTLGGGLALVEGGAVRRVWGPEEGLPSANLAAATLDRERGVLWFATNLGVAAARTHRLLARPPRERVEVPLLTRWDGMPADECVGISSPAIWVGDEAILVATVAGVAVLRRDRVLAGGAPRLRIEGIRADGRALPVGGTLELPASVRRLEIDVAVTDLLRPGAARLASRVLPGDSWHTRRPGTLTFERLPPGRYRLELRAWSALGGGGVRRTVALHVRPPLHRRPEAIAAAAILLLAVVVVTARRRLVLAHRRAREAELRLELAGRLHDAAGQLAAGLLLHLEAALGELEEGGAAPPTLRRSLDLAAEVSGALREIAHRLRSGALAPEERRGEARGRRRPLRTGRIGLQLPDLELLAGDRELLTAAAELVGNALRHGPEDGIAVRFAREGGTVTVEVRQRRAEGVPRDGPGGIGLERLVGIVHRRGGELDVRRDEGGGLTVVLRLRAAAEARPPSAAG